LLNGQQFYDYYETLDGRYLSLGGLEPQFKKSLCDAINKPELFELAISLELDHQIEFKSHVKDAIKSKEYEQWLSIFSAVDACVEPVLTLAEACQHEQLQARNMIVEVDGIKQIGCAINMSQSILNFKFKGCALGEHNNILVEEFAFSDDKMSQLKAKGIFGKI
jgi:crotonobetainyl-CoA:carnitine CoA-transferase CaiB-like acyl-CoA transferase